MARVKVITGPVDPTAYLDQVPRSQWSALVGARRSFLQVNLPYDCRELLRFVDESPAMLAELGYVNEDDFIARGLGLDPSLVQWAVNGLRTLKPDEPIPFARAVELGKHGGDHGNQHTGGKRQVCNTNLASASTGRAYLLARLRRDGHNGLLQQIEAGDLSAHAAALQVGYRKQKTALQQLAHWWQKAAPTEQQEFLDWVTAQRATARTA